MSHAVSKLVTTTHEGRARRRTGGADVKFSEARREPVEFIEVRCSKHLVAQATEVAHALVIRHDKNDVWAAALEVLGKHRSRNDEDKKNQ